MSDTLCELASKPAVIVCPETSALELLGLLIKHQASVAYVTTPEQYLLGIVSDFDLLKEISLDDFTSRSAADFVCQGIVTMDASAKPAETASFMRSGSCSRIAVVQNGRLIGEWTRGDHLNWLCSTDKTRTITRPEPASASEPVASETQDARRIDRTHPTPPSSLALNTRVSAGSIWSLT